MNITWITRSFLDYRIPIYEKIDRLCGNNLTVIYNAEVVPERCQIKLGKLLGERAIGLTGEIRFGGKKIENQTMANTGAIRIPIRPGLVSQIRKTNPDIILSDGFFQWTYAALIYRIFSKTKLLMCYERTKHTERNITKIRLISRKIASKKIDGICCNGIQTKQYLIEFGFSEKKLFVGNMTADFEGLQSKVKTIPPNKKEEFKEKHAIKKHAFLYVGQLIPRKGMMELLKAWSYFKKENTTLMLVGHGSEKDKILSFIDDYKIKSVKVFDQVDYEEIVNYYVIADVFIIPTLEDNWSLVVPEAMSCGLPIICSKYNGCWPEMVKPENGWVFDPLDETNFQETLQSAWTKREHWKQMGKKSFEIVQDYTPEKIAGQIYNACETIVSD